MGKKLKRPPPRASSGALGGPTSPSYHEVMRLVTEVLKIINKAISIVLILLMILLAILSLLL